MLRFFIWDYLGKIGSQVVSFVLSVVLTRLLLPEHYGIMGMAMVIIYLAALFLDLGFNKALVQQKDVSAIQFSSVFYLNIGLGAVLAVLCFGLSGVLSRFYNQPLIKPMFEVLSMVFILNALSLVPFAGLYRSMRFKTITVINISSAAISGIAGIWMAYNGYGVWSLVAQTLINSFFVFLFSIISARFIPLLQFNFSSIKPLWHYGGRLFASGFLDVLFTRLDIFLIGKIFQPATLGYYSRAQSMDVMVRQFSSASITSVLFPHISKHQDDRGYLKVLYLRYLHIILFVSVWLAGFLFLSANDIFIILFSERWSYAGELFRIMALGSFIWPASNLMCSLIMGVGNSKAFLKLEIYKKLLLLPVYIFGFLLGLKWFIVFFVIAFYFSLLVNIVFVSREVNVSPKEQLFVIAQYMFTGTAATCVTLLAARQAGIVNHILSLGFMALLSAGLYLLLASFLSLIGMDELKNFIRRFNLNFYDKRNKNIPTGL